jgi:hypothetical protein
MLQCFFPTALHAFKLHSLRATSATATWGNTSSKEFPNHSLTLFKKDTILELELGHLLHYKIAKTYSLSAS